MPVSAVGGSALSNTSTQCRRIWDPTHKDTRNLQNLTFGRDPEGELAEGINPTSTRTLGGRSIIFVIITVAINIYIYIHSSFLL
jgi:hypothetical protein